MPRELASAPPAGPLCRKVARGEPRGHSWLLAALLTAAVFCAYAPSLNGGFVWDDDGHVSAPALRSLGGLWRIWSSVDATQQYYPLLHSAFWLQHRLWGNAALGYRIVNGCLHALVACLFATFCRRLGLPGAYFAGALFALHPVQVESVAWISEQKNTLSAALALASAHLYWRFSDERVASLYAWATVLFGCALLTKTVVSVMPVALLLLLLWWQHGIISWRRDVLPLAPWIAVGALGGAITASIERATLGAEGSAFALDGGQRLLLAARAVTFYAGKLLWPAELLFVYPRVVPDVTSWTHYVPVVVLVLWAVACIGALRWWRGPLAVLLLFTCLLVPALGFVDVYPFTFSFVADHFQYLASSSLIALGAAVFEIGRMRFRVCSGIAVAIQAGVLTILGALTWRQSEPAQLTRL